MPRIAVSTDIPGGNAEVVAIDQRGGDVAVRPELRMGSPYRGWFAFHLDGLTPDRLYTIRVLDDEWAGAYHFSVDGVTWRQFGKVERVGTRHIVVRQVFNAESVVVAMMPPWRLEHLRRLVADVSDHPAVTVTAPWTSEEGRPGTMVTVSEGAETADRPRIWIIARTHAFEAVASWVAEGLLRWFLSDEDEARRLRSRATLSLSPMLDVDAVEVGSSGKHRPPVDFNRGWCDEPHWAAQKAVVEAIEQAGRADAFIDLHGPGGNRTWTYLYAEHEEHAPPGYGRDMARFIELLKESTAGSPVPFEGVTELSPGPENEEHWTLAYRYALRRWQPRIGAVLETTWSAPGAGIESFLATGRGLGRALAALPW